MITVGSMNAAFCSSYQKLISLQQFKETIPSDYYLLLFKERLQHDKKFTATAPGLLFSDQINLLQDQFIMNCLQQFSFLLFVKSLRGITQQPANLLQTEIWIGRFYFSDCWVPGFFLIWMSNCFSATLIMISSASARSFSHFSCFSSTAIFCCNAAADCWSLEDDFLGELFILLLEYFCCFSVAGKL